MKDKFLKTAFFITVILIFTSLSFNLLLQYQPSSPPQGMVSSSQVENIKKLINAGKLSDKEALFYKKLP